MGIRYKPELEATKIPTHDDIVWAAGVYEGEGNCQSISRNRLTIRVVQKDPELLYWLRDWFGGAVYEVRAKYKAPEDRCKVWLACGDRARLALALFYPYLTSRRKAQIDSTNALAFLGTQSSSGMSMEEIAAKLGSRLCFASWSDPLVKDKKAQQKHQNYLNRRNDPAYVEKCRAQSAAGNARLRLEKIAATQPERVN